MSAKLHDHIEREALRLGMTEAEYVRNVKERQRREREEYEFYRSVEDGSYWKEGGDAAE